MRDDDYENVRKYVKQKVMDERDVSEVCSVRFVLRLKSFSKLDSNWISRNN